jgi:hypothetical protein
LFNPSLINPSLINSLPLKANEIGLCGRDKSFVSKEVLL